MIVPPVISTAQGRVCPERVACQAPVLLVVVGVSALPVAQMTLMVPLAIGVPTAATPLKILVGGVLLPPFRPPPQPATMTVRIMSKKCRVQSLQLTIVAILSSLLEKKT